MAEAAGEEIAPDEAAEDTKDPSNSAVSSGCEELSRYLDVVIVDFLDRKVVPNFSGLSANQCSAWLVTASARSPRISS